MVGHPASFELTDPLAFCCGKSKYAQTNLRWKNYGIMGLTTDWLTTKRFTVSSHQSTNNTRRRIEHWLLGWPWQTHTNLYYKAAEWTTWHLITVLCFFFFFFVCLFLLTDRALVFRLLLEHTMSRVWFIYVAAKYN